MYSVLIDTIRLRIPSEYYNNFKQYLKDNGYKLRQSEQNKYKTKVYISGLPTTVLIVYQNNNRFGSGCYIEFYGLGTYNKAFKEEKSMSLMLTIDYLQTNDLLASTKVTKLDIATDIKAKPSQISVLRVKGKGVSVQTTINAYSDDWFINNTLYIEGSNLKQLRYKTDTKILTSKTKIRDIVGTKVYDINIAYNKANKINKQTPQAFNKDFRAKYSYWFDGDYFIIKEQVLKNFNFDEAKFSLVKKQNTTTAILYDKANKEGLNANLSRFEVRFIAKDIKGNLDGKNGVYELLNCVIKVLQRYKVDVSGKGINFTDCKICNWDLLNTYNK